MLHVNFRLHRLDVYDFEKTKRETALNNLETFIIDAQQRLESEEYAAAATSQEAENILKACFEISDWLYEDGFSVTAEVYEEKLSKLQKLTKDVYERVYEHRERPEVLKGMTSMLNTSKVFLNNMRNLSLSSEIFTQVEIDTLEKVIKETQVNTFAFRNNLSNNVLIFFLLNNHIIFEYIDP